MSKFNNAYERLHYKWAYGGDGFVGLDGWWNDYDVEEQQEDWFTLNEEYTKLSKALDKACHVIADLNDCTNIGTDAYSKCPFFDECNKNRFNGCIASKEKWKEWLLNHDE